MKRPTQVDVARVAGVSRATVSYVLNGQTDGRVPISDETRQRVLRAIAELGYEPDARAQSLRSGGTRTVGLIIPDIRNPHFWEFAEGVEREARGQNYLLLLSNAALNYEYADDVFKALSRRRIDGLILVGSFILLSEGARKTLDDLLERGFPIVDFSDDQGMDCVLSDYAEATKEVMSYLFSLGHRRIGLVYGVGSPEKGEDRLLPYMDCLREAGMPVEPELIIQCGPEIEDGYQAALLLLRRSAPPTAIVAINDLLAAGVLRAASDLGVRIPEDLSLVGFDDIRMANYLVPRLTTVSKDAIRSGSEAARLVFERIKDPDLPRQVVTVPARVVIRESTGPARLEGGDG